MKRHVAILLLLLPLAIPLLGCEPPKRVAKAAAGPPAPPPPPGAVVAAVPPAPVAAPPAASGQPPLPVEAKVGVFAGSLDDLAAPARGVPPSAPLPAADPNFERIKAEKGVGIKGRSLDEYEGMVVTPVKALFSAKERIAFDIAVPQALALFNASEGRNPSSHEEFMDKIIQFNQIKLPELPPGHKYLYDPERNELMVERPKRKSE